MVAARTTFLLLAPEVKAQVVINEFSSSDSSDWVEIYNVSNEVNLSGWSIKTQPQHPFMSFQKKKFQQGGLVICRRLTG